MPQDENVKNKIIDDFRATTQFPDVLGAIDGTNIRIVAPHEHPQVYIIRYQIVISFDCAPGYLR